MKYLILFLIVLVMVHAEAATIAWTAPTSYTDDTPIPQGAIENYNVYCRLTTEDAGSYSSVLTVPPIPTRYALPYPEDRVCAVTTLAQTPQPGGGTLLRESAYSTEALISKNPPVVPSLPSTITVEWASPFKCQINTTCKVP